jgi:hypothetical protein
LQSMTGQAFVDPGEVLGSKYYSVEKERSFDMTLLESILADEF